MHPRLTLARRRSRQALHPGYVRAAASKIDCPPEIYAYPAQARREAPNPWRLSKVPAAPAVPEPAPSLNWLAPVYAVAALALWFVGANVTPGV